MDHAAKARGVSFGEHVRASSHPAADEVVRRRTEAALALNPIIFDPSALDFSAAA